MESSKENLKKYSRNPKKGGSEQERNKKEANRKQKHDILLEHTYKYSFKWSKPGFNQPWPRGQLHSNTCFINTGLCE